jgi:thioredoxin-like negative regulator of GroEL
MPGLTMILFRDGRADGGEALAAILGEIAHSGADRHSVKEVDVQDYPAIAARYNVRTTPTILLMKEGQIVDRVVGTPTRILLHNLLDTRGAHTGATTQVA